MTPQDETLETATDVRLYLEQFQEPANRPSTLSVDQFAGALQVVSGLVLLLIVAASIVTVIFMPRTGRSRGR